jgi:uncharacterized protein DUF1153
MSMIRPELSAGSDESCGAEKRANPNQISSAIQLERSDAPLPPLPKRWVPRRKAEIVAAVRDGLMTLGEANERYALSVEEYLTWKRGLDLFGLSGLRVNKIQQCRHQPRSKKRRTEQGAHGPGGPHPSMNGGGPDHV